jgi:hypothetical protein
MTKVPSEIKESEIEEGEIMSECHNNTRVINFFKINKRNPRNNDFVSLRV